MRKMLIAAVIGATVGCASPTAPTARVKCTTQPRTYCAADGSRCWQEIDTYEAASCPVTPIS